MKVIAQTAILTSILVSQTHAENDPLGYAYLCSQWGEERRIEIYHPEQTALPCEVVYGKNGLSDVLWRAEHDPLYCEQKAQAFVAQQQQWGWQCEQLSSVQAP